MVNDQIFQIIKYIICHFKNTNEYFLSVEAGNYVNPCPAKLIYLNFSITWGCDPQPQVDENYIYLF